MLSKKKKIITLIILVLSVALIYFVVTLVMDINGKFNQGSCRFIDLVATSYIEVEDNSKEIDSLQEAKDLKLSISQRNTIDMILAPSQNISKIYINNISISKPNKLGTMFIYEKAAENRELKNDIELTPVIKDNECVISLNVDNEQFLKDVNVPNDKSYLKFDGTILNEYDLTLEDVKFVVKFNLNVVDNVGNSSVCSMEFEFPTEKFISEGIDVTRMSLEKFNFKSN